MNFFLDANLPVSLKEIFAKVGLVQHARDVNLSDASDDEIFEFAVKKKAILVTRDLEFGNPYLYPKNSHCGLIILRVPFHFTATQINRILKDFLASTETRHLRNAVTIVEPGKIRIR